MRRFLTSRTDMAPQLRRRRLAPRAWGESAVAAIAAAGVMGFLSLGAVGLGASLAPAPASAQTSSTGDPDAGGPDIEGESVPFRIRTPGSGRFAPERFVALGPTASYAGRAPRRAVAIGGDRLDLSSLPLLGRAFGRPPATSAITRERSIGPLLRCGDALVLDLRRAPVVVADMLSRPVAAISSARRHPILEIEARLVVEETAAAASPGPNCAPIGFVYLQGAPRDGRLVLAPPPDELFGW